MRHTLRLGESRTARPTRPKRRGMQVVDMFCGLGGFSAGAIDAGATVILGADKDSVPLKLWAANVPGGRATLATLAATVAP